MQLPPMSVILALPAPNYVNPEEHSPATSIVNLVMCPLVIFVTLLRVWTRLRVSRTFGIDDLLILIALIPSIVFCVISVLAELHYGWDRHVWDVPTENIELGLRLILTAECLFAAACTLTKVSMLFLVRKIVLNATGPLRLISSIAITVVSLQGIVFCFVVVFQCSPISDYWTMTFDPQPNCISQPLNLLAAGIVNTFTDFVVVLLPIPTVLKLKLPRRQQIVVVMLFAAGLVVCVAGCARTYYTYAVSLTYDQTWAGWSVWLTGAIELYVAVLCASIPALKPLFSKYLPNLLGTTARNASHGKSQDSSITATTTATIMVVKNHRNSRFVEDSYHSEIAHSSYSPSFPPTPSSPSFPPTPSSPCFPPSSWQTVELLQGQNQGQWQFRGQDSVRLSSDHIILPTVSITSEERDSASTDTTVEPVGNPQWEKIDLESGGGEQGGEHGMELHCIRQV